MEKRAGAAVLCEYQSLDQSAEPTELLASAIVCGLDRSRGDRALGNFAVPADEPNARW